MTACSDRVTVTPLPDGGESRGFPDSPVAWLESAFNRVAQNEMYDLPFIRAGIPVKASGFTLYEQQWIGCLLTPWTLSLLVLPGPGQDWSTRTPGERLALALPCGNVTFLLSEIAGENGDVRQYLSCSLMSPLDTALTEAQAITLAQQSARMALSLPVVDADAPRNLSRRSLFRQRSA